MILKTSVELHSKVAIILAAGSINHKLNSLITASECPALLPLNNRPIASYVLEFYLKYNIYPVLVIDKKYESDVVNELNYLNGKFAICIVENTKGVIHTLQNIFTNYGQLFSNKDLIVNLVTSIPTELPDINEVQIDETLSENIFWSCVTFENGLITLHSKNDTKKTKGFAFTGIFSVNAILLKDALYKLDNDFNDLLVLLNKLIPTTNLNFKKNKWIDCGHKINYLNAKTKLISSRSFNQVFVDEYDIITKESKNQNKLEDEFLFLKMLPNKIATLFPRAFDFVKMTDYSAYKMEYYGYPTVAELQLYWNLDEHLWKRFFYKLEFILKNFKNYPFSIGKEAYINFHYNKLIQRIEQYTYHLVSMSVDINFIENEVIVNGVRCKPFRMLQSKILETINAYYRETDFCIVHGDLCFNNMLFDVHSGIVKLIDPRGSFGETAKGIYGDIKYDLAKLAHSSIWNYDYLVNYQFIFSEPEKNTFEIVFNNRENNLILQTFTNELINNLGFNRDIIDFYVSLLFLSMAPLHTESITKSKAMYLHGIFILNKTLNKL